MILHGVREDGCPENGAKTLGRLAEKHLRSVVEEFYPDGTFITFASYERRSPISGQVVLMWHLNSPLETAIDFWKKAYKLYPNGIFLVNSEALYHKIKERYDRVHFLPRFIDPETLPVPKKDKRLKTMWYGNIWRHHRDKYQEYLDNNRISYWISKGTHSLGTYGIRRSVNRKEALDIVNDTQKVWAIGLSAMEAKYLGCEVIEYDGKSYDIIYPEEVIQRLREILETEKSRQQKTQ